MRSCFAVLGELFPRIRCPGYAKGDPVTTRRIAEHAPSAGEIYRFGTAERGAGREKRRRGEREREEKEEERKSRRKREKEEREGRRKKGVEGSGEEVKIVVAERMIL